MFATSNVIDIANLSGDDIQDFERFSIQMKNNEELSLPMSPSPPKHSMWLRSVSVWALRHIGSKEEPTIYYINKYRL